jgi:CRP-like cAMP-binding protein
MHPFKTFIENYVSLSRQDWEQIALCLTYLEVPKNTLLLEEGKVCRHLYFVEEGLLRFYTWKEGNDITKFFTEAPYAFTSQQSFTTGQAARENIQTLEPCRLWQMGHQDAHALLELPSWSTFVRKLIAQVQFYTENILIELQQETAQNRYQKLLATNPGLANRVPLKYLATYYGIAPQSLSRIRNKCTPARQKLT